MKYSERESLAVNKMKQVIRFSRLKRHQGAKRIVPSVYSTDPVEYSLGNFLSSIKSAKWHPGRNGRVFYPSLLDVVREKAVESILEPVRTKENSIKKFQETIDWIVENRRLPAYSGIDSIENAHWIRLNNMQSIKEGKLQGIWRVEFDSMIAEAGYPGFFYYANEGVVVDADISDIARFYKRYSRLPSQLSDDPNERKMYRKLVRLRQVKQGKTPLKWNPEIDATIKAKKLKNFFGA